MADPVGVPVGVLVMAYGSPQTPGDVAAYYTHIRRGRPPTDEQLAELSARYAAIGGTSPLRAVTEAQAAGLQAVLDERAPGRFRVFLGHKHAPPFVEDAVGAMVAVGLARAVGLVLAPHASPLSVGEYHRRAAAAVAGDALDYRGIGAWHRHPGYVELLASAVDAALARVPDGVGDAHVLFTAHSLPARVVAEGDTYAVQLRETAEDVSARLGLTRSSIAWQSAGRTPEPWLGPDVLEVLPKLAEVHGVRAVVVCPCGFVADHLEVLYDLDVEARAVAGRHGLHFERTAMPNDAPEFLAVLADLVTEHAG